jgi:hypothetical protein
MEHNIPKKSPNNADMMLYNHTESFSLIHHATSASNGHAYKYIIHHKPKPYMQPSIKINAGITKRICFPKKIVNIITQKLVSSTLGIPAIATLHTSMTATIMPIRVR